MGLFDRKEPDKGKADFSKVRSGSSSTAPEAGVAGATGAAGAQSYTVERGDTLWAISQRFYGKGDLWPRIHEANRGLIDDPDVIQPGWVLTIPAREEGGRI